MVSKNTLLFFAIVAAVAAAAAWIVSGWRAASEKGMDAEDNRVMLGAMQITSPAFGHHQEIPRQFTCDGANLRPSLNIAASPAGTKSFALIVDDPDAPRGTWVHWTLWNIPPETTEVPGAALPAGAREGKTSFGKPGWGGPCPPSGTHRYFFKLYALDTALPLAPAADAAALEKAMAGHVLAEAELVGLYKR